MACFATPYGLRYAAHCFNRADAQNNRSALIPAGGKLGVTSVRIERILRLNVIQMAREQKRIVSERHRVSSISAGDGS